MVQCVFYKIVFYIAQLSCFLLLNLESDYIRDHVNHFTCLLLYATNEDQLLSKEHMLYDCHSNGVFFEM